jgi:hypothetical protein
MTISPAVRSALRLVRGSSLRTATVIITIAIPTALATAGNLADWSSAAALTWSAVAVAAAVLLATQSSPEPTSLATTGAWRVAGASPSASRRPHRLTGLFLCWVGSAVGLGIGSLVAVATAHEGGGWGGVLFLAVALGVVGMIALVPTPHPLPSRSKRRFVVTEVAWVVGGVLLGVAVVVIIPLVGSVRTDFDAGLTVPFAATVTTLVVGLALGPALRAVFAGSRRIPALRPVLAAATRHRTPAVVRLVLAAAMVVALTGTVLGASVGRRTARFQDAAAELQRVPVVPPTVMAVTLPITDRRGDFVLPVALPGETLRAIRNQYPDAQHIPVTWVTDGGAYLFQSDKRPPAEGPSVSCAFSVRCALPVIVADPRLAAVYGPAQPSYMKLSLGLFGSSKIQPALSAPRTETLIYRRVNGAPLPTATFHGLIALAIDPTLVAQRRSPTDIRTVFVTRNRPFTADERAELRTIVSTHQPNGAPATVITSDDRSTDLHSPLGHVPWAATARSTQWSIATIAALFALLVVISTGIVDALDRRRDNDRLELLGATPNQVRGAAALHSGLVLAVGAILAAAAVVPLVAYGLTRFSAAQPAIAVPFVFPLSQIAFLVLGVPLLGALLAAATAREARRAPRRHPVTASPISHTSPQEP